MTLTPGSCIGAYEVVALLGTGGMGEVYRAKDLALKRDVALKVLPDSFIHDLDRSVRFRREAQLLASLNHPHIGAIYGLEEQDGVSALVLELVEGPTLREIIEASTRRKPGPGGGLPVAEVTKIAGQIAEALDAAHESGIVHRDLKPANIKVRPDGTVKVLDFGLAKAMESNDSQAPAAALTNSPTVISPAATAAGVVLGTASYMSPEQARGQATDKRTDVWAFGCVVFEMLTGTLAFPGHTASDVIAGVLRGEPDWSRMPTDAGALERLVRCCLERETRSRLRDIGDIKLVLSETAGTGRGATEARRTSFPPQPLWALGAAAAAGALMAAVVLGLMTRSHSSAAASLVEHFQLATPPENPLAADNYGANVAISPDGSRMVYSSTRGGKPILMMRRFDGLQAETVAGSEGGVDPIFSPDGTRVAFITFKELKVVETAGGPSVTVCPVDAYFSGASWGVDNTIVFTQMSLGLFRVPASGGQPEKLAVPDVSRQEQAFERPVSLPGGAILYTVVMSDGSRRTVARDSQAASTRVVIADGFDPHYLPPGYLVYAQGERLLAVRFNPSTLKAEGAAVPLQDGVYTKTADGIANVSLAANGTGAFVAGHGAEVSLSRLVWLGPHGVPALAALPESVEAPRNLRLSPDGRRVVLTAGPPGLGQLWVYTLDGSHQPLKLTFHDHNLFPTWSPDGRQIMFMNRTNGVTRLKMIASDASEVEPKNLSNTDEEVLPWSWSPDGTFVLLSKMPGKLWLLHVADNTATAWLKTPFVEDTGTFSPDGRWIAYSTNQTGSNEVWVRPFPGPGAPVRISSSGGVRPIWKDGGQIDFEKDGKVLAARVLTETPEFRAEVPRVVLDGGFMVDDTDANLRFIDLAPDGRFIAVEASPTSGTASIVLVQHWDEEIRRLLTRSSP